MDPHHLAPWVATRHLILPPPTNNVLNQDLSQLETLGYVDPYPRGLVFTSVRERGRFVDERVYGWPFLADATLDRILNCEAPVTVQVVLSVMCGLITGTSENGDRVFTRFLRLATRLDSYEMDVLARRMNLRPHAENFFIECWDLMHERGWRCERQDTVLVAGAIRRGQERGFRWLLEHGHPVDAPAPLEQPPPLTQERRPLIVAALTTPGTRDLSIIRELLRRGARFAACDKAEWWYDQEPHKQRTRLSIDELAIHNRTTFARLVLARAELMYIARHRKFPLAEALMLEIIRMLEIPDAYISQKRGL